MAVIAIHGGAGAMKKDRYDNDRLKSYESVLVQAIQAGSKILNAGGSSLDAVVAAVIVLEDSELFNAGKGSVFSREGTIEMDASIMDGKTLKAGAAATLTHIRNPILAAKMVMEKTPHRLLAGEAAEKFLQKQGLKFEEFEYFHTEKRYKQYLQAKDVEMIELDHGGSTGTVGAVALDDQGNLAAATSTGGMTYKYSGRVSDSAMIGAGTYAHSLTCAVSATGTGDEFIRHCSCFDLHALMLYQGHSLDSASRLVLDKIKSTGGSGGLIAIDKDGNISMPFNSNGMFRASIDHNGEQFVAIF